MPVITFRRKELKLELEVLNQSLETIIKHASVHFGEDITNLELVYIDGEGDYIAVQDQQDWDFYIEELTAGLLAPKTAAEMFIFDQGDSLAKYCVEGSVNGSLAHSFVEVNNKSVEVMMDDEVKAEIVQEIAMNSAILTPALRSKRTENENPATVLAQQTDLQAKIDAEVKRIIEQKIKAGELIVCKPEREGDFCHGFRLIFNKVQDRREKNRRALKKLKRKGVKFVKKEIRKLTEVSKHVFSSVKKLFGA